MGLSSKVHRVSSKAWFHGDREDFYLAVLSSLWNSQFPPHHIQATLCSGTSCSEPGATVPSAPGLAYQASGCEWSARTLGREDLEFLGVLPGSGSYLLLGPCALPPINNRSVYCPAAVAAFLPQGTARLCHASACLFVVKRRNKSV